MVKDKQGMRGKRSQAQIITVILIILLVLALVVIVWNFVNPFIKESSEKIDTEFLLVELLVTNFWIDAVEDLVYVTVSRGPNGDMDTMKFIFYYEDGSTEIRDVVSPSVAGTGTGAVIVDVENIGEEDFIEPLEKITYMFPRGDLRVDGNDPVSVSVMPCFEGECGIESEQTGYGLG